MTQPLKPTVRAPVKRAPRYSVRPGNGGHHVFDAYHFKAVDWRREEAEAQSLADEFNRQDAERRRP